MGQQGKRLDDDILAVADYQVQHGKKLNLGDAVKAKEKMEGKMKGKMKGKRRQTHIIKGILKTID